MDNPGKLFGQIAAEAEITPARAKIAVYLFGLARDGRSLSDAAKAMRRSPGNIKEFARDFMIDFPDYRPFSRLEKKGLPRPEARIRLQIGVA